MRFSLGHLVLMAAVCVASPAFSQELTTKQVVDNLDQKAQAFSSLDASITRIQVEYGVKTPEESGRIYMRRGQPSPRILYDITKPDAARKTLLIDKGIGTMYFRNTNQYAERNVGNGGEVTELLMIGFGVTSDAFGKSYNPTYKGREAMDGVQTVVLELAARTEGAQFKAITLWLDPSTWTPLLTRVSESSKSYSDFKYSNVRLNRGVADSVFRLQIPKDARKQ